MGGLSGAVSGWKGRPGSRLHRVERRGAGGDSRWDACAKLVPRKPQRDYDWLVLLCRSGVVVVARDGDRGRPGRKVSLQLQRPQENVGLTKTSSSATPRGRGDGCGRSLEHFCSPSAPSACSWQVRELSPARRGADAEQRQEVRRRGLRNTRSSCARILTTHERAGDPRTPSGKLPPIVQQAGRRLAATGKLDQTPR